MSDARERKGSIALQALTPLLDTLFILLFALLALSETRSSTSSELVRIRLPRVEPSGGESPADLRRLVLELGADSLIRLPGSPGVIRTRGELDRALAAALGNDIPEDVAIEIHGDQEAHHGVAVELLQHLRVLGFRAVSLLALGTRGAADSFGATR